MLSESSYITGLWVYSAAGAALAIYLMWCLRRSLPRFLLLLLGFLCAAWLLTPAYPEAGVDSFAPALIVLGFQLLTDGLEAANHAIKPLIATSVAAVVLAIIVYFVMRLLQRPTQLAQEENP